jgi:hypothetical protein
MINSDDGNSNNIYASTAEEVVAAVMLILPVTAAV